MLLFMLTVFQCLLLCLFLVLVFNKISYSLSLPLSPACSCILTHTHALCPSTLNRNGNSSTSETHTHTQNLQVKQPVITFTLKKTAIPMNPIRTFQSQFHQGHVKWPLDRAGTQLLGGTVLNQPLNWDSKESKTVPPHPLTWCHRHQCRCQTCRWGQRR